MQIVRFSKAFEDEFKNKTFWRIFKMRVKNFKFKFSLLFRVRGPRYGLSINNSYNSVINRLIRGNEQNFEQFGNSWISRIIYEVQKVSYKVFKFFLCIQ